MGKRRTPWGRCDLRLWGVKTWTLIFPFRTQFKDHAKL